MLTELNFKPSPQISIQISFVTVFPPLHCQPASTAQLEFQPSLLFKLPSSQYEFIELNRLPSPQISDHVSFDVGFPPDHVQPISTKHNELQPSLFKILPSSHALLRILIFFSSPQTSLQISLEFELPPIQLYPVSIEHVELQPSPLEVFPSSQ